MTEYIEIRMQQSVVVPKDQWGAMEDDDRAGWLEHNVSDQSVVAGEWVEKAAALEDYADFIDGKELHCIKCKEYMTHFDADGLVLDGEGNATCSKCRNIIADDGAVNALGEAERQGLSDFE